MSAANAAAWVWRRGIWAAHLFVPLGNGCRRPLRSLGGLGKGYGPGRGKTCSRRHGQRRGPRGSRRCSAHRRVPPCCVGSGRGLAEKRTRQLRLLLDRSPAKALGGGLKPARRRFALRRMPFAKVDGFAASRGRKVGSSGVHFGPFQTSVLSAGHRKSQICQGEIRNRLGKNASRQNPQARDCRRPGRARVEGRLPSHPTTPAVRLGRNGTVAPSQSNKLLVELEQINKHTPPKSCVLGLYAF